MPKVSPAPVQCWLVSTLERVFPKTPAQRRASIQIDAARGERVSFQVAMRNAMSMGFF